MNSVPALFALVLFLGGCIALLSLVLGLDLQLCSSSAFVFSLEVGSSSMLMRCYVVVVLALSFLCNVGFVSVSEFVPVSVCVQSVLVLSLVSDSVCFVFMFWFELNFIFSLPGLVQAIRDVYEQRPEVEEKPSTTNLKTDSSPPPGQDAGH